MKKLLLLLVFTFSAVTYAQEEDYSVFLDDALEAINNNDEQQYIAFIKVFTAALEEKKITPQNIPQSYIDKYVETILQATFNKIKITDEIAQSAKTFFEYEIQKNNADAMTCMGFFYEMGYAVPQDYQKAKYYYQQAIVLDNGSGMYCLAFLYDRGLGVALDYEKAVIWYKKAIEKGNIRAMSNLGVKYQNGRGVKQNYNQAFYWYQQAAKKGNAGGMGNLGVMYENGYGVEQDYSQALYWYKKAAEKGVANAMNNLGLMCRKGLGVSQDYSQAKYWYEKAIKKGNTSAMNNLGDMYYDGKGVAKDYTQAIDWYKKAAEKGNSHGWRNLGIMYNNGYGVEKDYSQAMQYYQRAVEEGNADALADIAWLYDRGLGVDIDWETALSYYQKAADKDVAWAKRELGTFYLFGIAGVTQNIDKAKDLFQQAADAGNDKAKNYLKVLNDARNGTYYQLTESQYGNQIYLSESSKEDLKNELPYILSKYGFGFGFEINYTLGESQGVQIWPASRSERYKRMTKEGGDRIISTSYSGCSFLTEKEGVHPSTIAYKEKEKGGGHRGVGYIYYDAVFQYPDEELIIKVPAMFCWKPRKYYN